MHVSLILIPDYSIIQDFFLSFYFILISFAMGSHEKEKKKTAVRKFDKEDLYHDVKQEKKEKLSSQDFEKNLLKMEIELVKLQEWVKAKKLKVVVIFEGRDAAGKGGVIKTISGCLNPRICRIVALGIPTEKEKSQWYFQRYVTQLPAAGEIVLFDRSWYNRAGVEKVMGYCSNEEYEEFLRSCPEFEKMLIRSGIILIVGMHYVPWRLFCISIREHLILGH